MSLNTPPRDEDLEQMVELGLAARALGESPTFSRVVNHLTNINITQIFSAATSAARDDIFYQQQALKQILAEIQRLEDTGRMAAEALAERDDEAHDQGQAED